MQASNKKRHHGINLSPATLAPLTKEDAYAVSIDVTCSGQPFPAHASIGLPGFTNPAIRMRIDSDNGKIRFDLPRTALAAISSGLMTVENDYCYTRYVKVDPKDVIENGLTLAPLELKLRRVMVA